jgi:hypothetical protein
MNPDHAASCLLTDLFGRDLIDQRAPLSVLRPLDEVDELLEEIRAAEFEGKGSRP